MRKKIVAGNWKMNTLLHDGVKLAEEINHLLADNPGNETTVVLAPPFLHLTEVSKVVNRDRINIASQNCSYEDKGAYTGEVSAEMLKSAGLDYVIIGHSERRAYFNETDEELNKKVKLVLKNKMSPIFCCGEVLAERQAGNHFNLVKNQIVNGLFNLETSDFIKVVIAYEPVWAIGTGVTASPDQAQEMHAFIRGLIVDKYGKEVADSTSLLYGGSCKSSNAKELFANPDVDGGLIGGAALNAADFLGIISAF